MEERHLVVARTARYAVAGEEREPAEAWFLVHGYGQLARRFLRAFAPLDDGTRLLVAPEAMNHFYLNDTGGPHGPQHPVGATWMTREDRLAQIADYVAYLDSLHRHVVAGVERQPARTVVLGFSQGVATASRWVALGSARPHDLVLWGSPLPDDLDLARAQAAWRDIRVWLVSGAADSFYDEAKARAQADRLAGAGIEARVEVFDGGHEIHAEALARLTP